MPKKTKQKTNNNSILVKFVDTLIKFVVDFLYLVGMGLFGVFYLPYILLVRLTRSTSENVRVQKRKVINAVKKNKFIQAQIEKQRAKKDVLLLELATHEEIRSQHKEFFKYVALTEDGRLERGNVRGYSKTDVHEFLLTEGYDVFDIKLYQPVHIFAVHTYRRWADLPVVTHNNDLSAHVQNGQSCDIRLAGFINNNDIKTVGFGIEAFHGLAHGHDPYRYGGLAFFHQLSGFGAIHWGCFTRALTDLLYSLLPSLKGLLDINILFGMGKQMEPGAFAGIFSRGTAVFGT